MASVAQQYTRELKNALSYNAAWLPSDRLDLGVIGEVREGIFVPQDDVRSLLGLEVRPISMPSDSGNSLTYQSHSGVEVEVKAQGATSAAFQFVGQAQAGIAVSFGSKGACLFSIPRYQLLRAVNQITFKRNLLERIDSSWHRGHAVVTEVILAESATILVAEDNGARVEISADAEVKNPLTDIGQAGLGLRIAHTSGHVLAFVGATGLTPLFRALRVKDSWFKTLEVEQLGSATRLLDGDVEGFFEEVEL